MAACETVKKYSQEEKHTILRRRTSRCPLSMCIEKPFTKSLAQSIHTWQEEQNKRGEEGGRKFSTANVKDQCLVLEIS